MSDDRKRGHLARLMAEKGGRVWVLFDERHTMRGRPGESRKSLLARWRQAHGDFTVLVRIRGVCRPSELAMQVADLQRQEDTEGKIPIKDDPEEGTGMKPFRTRDGRLIVDQLCRCGHLQSRHGHRLAELPDTLIGVPRHGPCLEDGCACERFTFKDFVYREEEK